MSDYSNFDLQMADFEIIATDFSFDAEYFSGEVPLDRDLELEHFQARQLLAARRAGAGEYELDI